MFPNSQERGAGPLLSSRLFLNRPLLRCWSQTAFLNLNKHFSIQQIDSLKFEVTFLSIYTVSMKLTAAYHLNALGNLTFFTRGSNKVNKRAVFKFISLSIHDQSENSEKMFAVSSWKRLQFTALFNESLNSANISR